MTPGNSRILTCPHCGGQKEVLSLMSGNTFNAIYWSDGKMDAPMYPVVSSVQKCPHCEKYFYPHKQEAVYSKDNWSFELGSLNFEECMEAIAQFEAEGMSEDEEINDRVLAVFAFNDKYYREKAAQETPTEKDRMLFVDNIKKLLTLVNTDETPVFVAELYREIGEFDTAKSLIKLDDIQDDFVMARAEGILKRCEQNDTTAFQISI